MQPTEDDKLDTYWYGSFSHGVLRESMNHTFQPICCGWNTVKMKGGTECRRFHAFSDSCKQKGRPKKGHGLCMHRTHHRSRYVFAAVVLTCSRVRCADTGTVTRAEIRLTTPSAHTLTKGGKLLAQNLANSLVPDQHFHMPSDVSARYAIGR